MGEKEKQAIAGLLGVVDTKDWSALDILVNSIGLGFGASTEAKRLALLGYYQEQIAILDRELEKHKPKRGRPSKDPLYSKDAMRAFMLWELSHNFVGVDKRVTISNRSLIDLAIQFENILNIPNNERVFPNGNWEQSVSRGKKILEIDNNWQSKVCDKLDDI